MILLSVVLFSQFWPKPCYHHTLTKKQINKKINQQILTGQNDDIYTAIGL